MDSPLLLDAFIKRIAIRSGKNITGVSKEALDLLMNYAWPGNVRELINAIEYAFVLAHKVEILPRHLPPELAMGVDQSSCTPARQSAAMVGKERLLDALEQTGGKRAEAARHLKVSRVTLWKRMKKHGIRVESRVR
jgi:two-component system, NtrC family, response regulator HydG